MEKLDPNVAIDMLGGTYAAAEFFDVKPPSISEWRWSGIPRARAMYLRVARPDVYAAAAAAAAKRARAPDKEAA